MQVSDTFSFITEYINYVKEARQETDKFRESINKTNETEKNANSQSASSSYSVKNETEGYFEKRDRELEDFRKQVFGSQISKSSFSTNANEENTAREIFNQDLFGNKKYASYSQSELMDNMPQNAMADIEQYRKLVLQKMEQSRFFANHGISEDDVSSGAFAKDRNGYDIQEDYKKRFGSNIEDTSARDKLSDDIRKVLQTIEQKTNNTFDYKNFDPYKQPEAKKSTTVQQALGKGINDLGQGVTDLTGSMLAGGLLVGAATSAIQLGTQAIKEMAKTMYENNIKETTLKNLGTGDIDLVNKFVANNYNTVTKSEALNAASLFAGLKMDSNQQTMALNFSKDLAGATGQDFSTISSLVADAIRSQDATGLMNSLHIVGGGDDDVNLSTINTRLEAGWQDPNHNYTDAFNQMNEYLTQDERYSKGLAESAKEKEQADWVGGIIKGVINSFTTNKNDLISAYINDKNYNYDYTGGENYENTLNKTKTQTWQLSDKSNDTIAKSAQNKYMSNVNNSKTANITINLNSTGNTEEDAKMMANTVRDSWNSEELNNVGSVNVSGNR